MSPEPKAQFLFDVAARLDTPDAFLLRDQQFGIVQALARSQEGIRVSDAAALLRHVYVEHKRALDQDSLVVDGDTTTLAALLLERIIDVSFVNEDESEIQLMANLWADLPALQSDEQHEAAREVVRAYGEGMVRAWILPETPEIFREAAMATETAAEYLQWEVDDIARRLRARADKIETDAEQEPEPDYDDDARREFYVNTDELFDRLASEIRGRNG